MNICMYTSEFPPDLGGISTYVYNLSKKLMARGNKVTVITRSHQLQTYNEFIDGINVYRVIFFPYFPYPFKIHEYYVNNLFRKLERNFDLVHVHGTLIPPLKTSLPVIFTSHGSSKRRLDTMEVKTLRSFLIKLFRNQLFELESKIVRSSDVISAVSKASANDLLEYHNIDKEIYIMKNGVDASFFIESRKKIVSQNEVYNVFYAGRLESIKGLNDLVESAVEVCKKYPHIIYTIAGTGSLKNYLEKRVSQLCLNDNFLFVGYLDRFQLLQYYQKATIFVLPSYREGLPTSLMEAMSCGIALIATNVEGTSELIIDGENGLLIPPKNPSKLAEVIIELLENENLRMRLGANARKYIEDNYDWEKITDDFEKMYSKLLSVK